MTKYLVDVYLPAAGRHYDIYLPCNKKIGEVKQLLLGVAGNLTDGMYQGTQDSLLFNKESGEPLDSSLTVFDAGIRNASKLMLI